MSDCSRCLSLRPDLNTLAEKATYNTIEEVEMSTAGLSEYDKFIKEYKRKHECCPKCYSKQFKVTLIDYVWDVENKEEYKDMNKCKCLNCGNVHLVHDRVQDNTNIS